MFKPALIAVVTTLVVSGSADAKPAMRPDVVRIAALEARVGHFRRALALLDDFRVKDTSEQAAAAFVRASALFELGRHAEAKLALARVTDPALEQAVGWLNYRIASTIGDDQATLEVARTVLKKWVYPRLMQAQLELDHARIEMGQSATRRVARKKLTALTRHTERSIRAGATSVLADNGDQAAMLMLLVDYADTEFARRRQHHLSALRLNEEKRQERAEVLFAFRAYHLAAPEYRALTRSSTPDVRQRAQLRLATIQMRLREKYPDSEVLLRAAVKGPEKTLRWQAGYRLGLTLGHLGQFQQASDQMRQTLDSGFRGRTAVNARYQIGRLSHEAGDYESALQDHRRFLATKPPDRPKWTWFEAWTLIRKGDCVRAREILRSLSDHPNTLVGPKAIYWTARCHQIEGNIREARAALAQLERRAPLSYYGLLGRFMNGKVPPRMFPRVEPRDTSRLGAWTVLLSPKRSAELIQVKRLVRVGEIQLARHVYDRSGLPAALGKLPQKKRSLARSEMRQFLERWGDLWKGLKSRERRLAWRSNFAEVDSELRQRVYPAAYLPITQAVGRTTDVSSWWLLAHMLQESRYKERAKSHAIALGTMQIIPRTARRIADEIGFPNGDFATEQLFRPGVALRQSSWYLDALRREFRGNVMLAIAAYNGGPLRMQQHLRNVGEVPFDVMIEEIGTHEMRNYARKVVDHVVRYLELYAPDDVRTQVLESLRLPLKLPDPRMELLF